MRRVLNMAGMIAPVWLVLGVAYVASLRPEYSHYQHLMSRLGEKTSTTEFISPLVNNYPLAVLFCAFGLFVVIDFHSWQARLAGLLIMLHGVLSAVAGFYACDAGCPMLAESASQTIHNMAGAFMFMSLILAMFLLAWVAAEEIRVPWFARYSMASAVVTLVFLGLTSYAMATGNGAGLYQRISYGVAACWIFVLAFCAWQQAGNAAGEYPQ